MTKTMRPVAALCGVSLALLMAAPVAAQQPNQQPPAAAPAPPPGPPGPPGLRGPRPPGWGPQVMMGRGDYAGMCGPRAARFIEWRLDQIEQAVRPSDAQRPAFNDFKAAVQKAEEIVRASCPAELPLTPTGRLDVMEKRLEAMLQGVKTVRPALETFFKSLDDEQKARFIAVGPQPGRHWGWREHWRERWNRFWSTDGYRGLERPRTPDAK
jgi:hypothetical protein